MFLYATHKMACICCLCVVFTGTFSILNDDCHLGGKWLSLQPQNFPFPSFVIPFPPSLLFKFNRSAGWWTGIKGKYKKHECFWKTLLLWTHGRWQIPLSREWFIFIDSTWYSSVQGKTDYSWGLLCSCLSLWQWWQPTHDKPPLA